ncbi:MBL fold metallo-hydrolase [Pseudonocardia humida]|uniref:MBL fold metallo-hydrolase n=1 Tax=Pseudonocardia humida TaxID=2800819 RepID=A0ABT1A1Y1_9PSEU|nr:MBL fold metallo-hydrolase [Pseudonocardia humida]MCO1656997.1 MBL fold metallo-hydrolase [Pseudonocardia humida]
MLTPDTLEVRAPLQERAWRERVLPPVERLDHGTWSVPVPIPDNPLRYTLSYLVPGDTGLVVVDPGWESDEGWAALTAGLAAAGAGAGDVVGVVATHIHPDHHGLTARLRAASGAWVAMHPAEAETLPARQAAAFRAGQGDGERPQGVAGAGGWLTHVCGAPAETVDEIMSAFLDRDAADGVPGFGAMAEPDVLLSDGDLAPLPGRRLRAVWTPGHTPGHLCLVDETAQAVLTGDHVLPGITPNISAHPGQGPSMLARYLDSLRRMAAYDDHDALPAHQYRFRGLAARTDQLIEHHRERCAEILAAVAEIGEPTMWQLAERLTWSRTWAQIGPMRLAALGETAAHVEYLTERGELSWDTASTEGPALVRAA